MIESIKAFFSDNIITIGAVIGMIVIVAIFMFRNNSKNAVEIPVPTPSHDLEGMDNVNMVCDLANGVCHPQNMMPEQEQHNMETVAAPMEHSEQ